MAIRGKKISMVMQDPMTSLNPLKKIGKQIEESITYNQGIKGEEARKMAIEMLSKVGIPDPERRAKQYPHEFSGGMRQRVVIAIAAACRPDSARGSRYQVLAMWVSETLKNGGSSSKSMARACLFRGAKASPWTSLKRLGGVPSMVGSSSPFTPSWGRELSSLPGG